MDRLVELRIHRRVPLGLAVVAAALCATSFGLEVLQHGVMADVRGMESLQGYLGVDRESNLPTWFQSGLLATCAVLFWTAGDDAVAARAHRVLPWRGLALVFTYLSIDELVMLHERADEPLQRMFGTSGALLWAWVLLAAPLVLIFALAYVPFLLGLPPATRAGLVLAGAVYVGGAIGMEMVGSHFFALGGLESPAYQLSATLEEALEMSGLVLAIATLVRHAERVAVVALPPSEAGVRSPAG